MIDIPITNTHTHTHTAAYITSAMITMSYWLFISQVLVRVQQKRREINQLSGDEALAIDMNIHIYSSA